MTKTEIRTLINSRVTFNFNQGRKGLSKICHFLFKTNIHILLSHPSHQRQSWLAADSSARNCSQRNPNRRRNHPDTGKLLLSRIHTSRLIPALTTFDQTPPSRTATGPNKTRIMFTEIEEDPLLYQDPNQNQNLGIIWNLLLKKNQCHYFASGLGPRNSRYDKKRVYTS